MGMIKHSESYEKAVIAGSRKQYIRAIFDLISPDAQIDAINSNNESEYSRTNQLQNRGEDESSQKIASLEYNRWALDGTWEVEPDDKEDRKGQVGWESESISKESNDFDSPYPYVEQLLSGITILQAVTIQFSQKEWNGYPKDFSVDIYSASGLEASISIEENEKKSIVLEGFTAYAPTKISLTIKKWSEPYRRTRVIGFFPGLYEKWDSSTFKSSDIYNEATFSCLSLPYGTCDIEIHNENHRFDPYAQNSIFKSIEERQAIKIELGMRLEDGSIEWLPGGTYYQQSGGWELKDLTVKWRLIDIVGMILNRRFVVPDELPSNLSGWIQAIVSSAGTNFSGMYTVDEDVADIPLSATKRRVSGMKCGEILRYACMATSTWPRQDVATGKLRIGKILRDIGNKISLDNMNAYPAMEANEDIADITFSIDPDEEGNEREATFTGTNTASEKSLSISNPFVHTEEDATNAARSCLIEYGGRKFTVKSRGNPSSEIGDIMSIATQFNTEIAARLYKQQLKLDNGVMHNMPSYFLQSPNDGLYENIEILTGTGTWTIPEGVSKIRATAIQGGFGGRGGGGGILVNGEWNEAMNTDGGDAGRGGNVFSSDISVSVGQAFSYSCGVGGAGGKGGNPGEDGEIGEPGTHTIFGSITSANGKQYKNGIMDTQNGGVYAATGGENSLTYGCGGIGGKNGENGVYLKEIIKQPGSGSDGIAGRPGCVIVEW